MKTWGCLHCSFPRPPCFQFPMLPVCHSSRQPYWHLDLSHGPKISEGSLATLGISASFAALDSNEKPHSNTVYATGQKFDIKKSNNPKAFLQIPGNRYELKN